MKIFIGYEPNHPDMFEVCRKSILKFNSTHEIIPLKKSEISKYTRPFQNESTDFAFTRFLVPHLCDYEGQALFCDGDFLWFCDPEEVMDYFYDEDTVSVVRWADSIGDIPAQYNAMVNYYKFNRPKAVHFTDGGPWLNINDSSEYTAAWMQIRKRI